MFGPIVGAVLTADDGTTDVAPWHVPPAGAGMAMAAEVVGVQIGSDPVTGQSGLVLLLRAERPGAPPRSAMDLLRAQPTPTIYATPGSTP